MPTERGFFCVPKKGDIMTQSQYPSSESFLVRLLLGYYRALTPQDYIRHPSFDICPIDWNVITDHITNRNTKKALKQYFERQPGNYVNTIFESRAKWKSLDEFSEYIKHSIICNASLIIDEEKDEPQRSDQKLSTTENFAINAEHELVIYIVALDGSVMDYNGNSIAEPTYQTVFISQEELGIAGCNNITVNTIVGDHHHIKQSRSESPTTGQQSKQIEKILIKLGYNTDRSLSYYICDNDQDVLLSKLRLTLFTGKQAIKYLHEIGKLNRLDAFASQTQIDQAINKLESLIEDDAPIDISAGYYDYKKIYPDYTQERLAFARGLYKDIRTFKSLTSKSPKDYTKALHDNISRVMAYLMSPEQDIEKVLALPANARPKWYTDLADSEEYNPTIHVLDFCVSSTGFAFYVVDEQTPANRLQIPPTIDTINQALVMQGLSLPDQVASVSAIAIHSSDSSTQNWTICGDPLLVSKMRILINIAEEFYRILRDGKYSNILRELHSIRHQKVNIDKDSLSKEIYTKLIPILSEHWKPEFRQNFDSKPSLKDTIGFIANHRRGSYLFDINTMSSFLKWFVHYHELISRSIIEAEPKQGIEYPSNWLSLTNISQATTVLNLVLQDFSVWLSKVLIFNQQNQNQAKMIKPIFSSSFKYVILDKSPTENPKLSNFLAYQGIHLQNDSKLTFLKKHYIKPMHKLQGTTFPHRQATARVIYRKQNA